MYLGAVLDNKLSWKNNTYIIGSKIKIEDVLLMETFNINQNLLQIFFFLQ